MGTGRRSSSQLAFQFAASGPGRCRKVLLPAFWPSVRAGIIRFRVALAQETPGGSRGRTMMDRDRLFAPNRRRLLAINYLISHSRGARTSVGGGTGLVESHKSCTVLGLHRLWIVECPIITGTPQSVLIGNNLRPDHTAVFGTITISRSRCKITRSNMLRFS
ncbi:hypothetical protein ZHAS_00016126 [Anopheles sinensis]|uniref:Uncharacterized protein n=1 Tax=Anopheles sinensis TaxID=74873 RepID=A0A084WCR6_ANOSI|nr:hypothetical protein ZHAS_00016126 [Anopheles sinensis]